MNEGAGTTLSLKSRGVWGALVSCPVLVAAGTSPVASRAVLGTENTLQGQHRPCIGTGANPHVKLESQRLLNPIPRAPLGWIRTRYLTTIAGFVFGFWVRAGSGRFM